MPKAELQLDHLDFEAEAEKLKSEIISDMKNNRTTTGNEPEVDDFDIDLSDIDRLRKIFAGTTLDRMLSEKEPNFDYDPSIDQTPLSYQTYYDPRPKPNPEPPYNQNLVYQKSKSKASYTQSGRSYTMSALDQKTTVSFQK